MWHNLFNENDIKNLMEIYGGFHDSCVCELSYKSGLYVTSELAMQPIECDRLLRVVFHRQYRNPMAIEIEFNKLIKFNLRPTEEGYSSEILDVSFFFEAGKIFWGDSEYYKTQRDEYDGTWIIADSAKWRTVDERIGSKTIYFDHG
jgi:hypothetical protein